MSTELTIQPPGQLAPREEPPASMFTVLANIDWQALDTTKAEAMLAMMERAEDRQARKDYFAAISDFQARCPIIEKADKAYDKQYARMDRIWRAIKPITTDLGLSVTWQTVEFREGGICHVEGELAHRAGHSVRLVRDVPIPDMIKGQNKTQQAGSAETYAKRYALCAALGIVTGDDDDGHGAQEAYVTPDQLKYIQDAISKFPFPEDEEKETLKWMGLPSLDRIPAKDYTRVLAELRRSFKKIQEADQ